jgi:hypothetical protein
MGACVGKPSNRVHLDPDAVHVMPRVPEPEQVVVTAQICIQPCKGTPVYFVGLSLEYVAQYLVLCGPGLAMNHINAVTSEKLARISQYVNLDTHSMAALYKALFSTGNTIASWVHETEAVLYPGVPAVQFVAQAL